MEQVEEEVNNSNNNNSSSPLTLPCVGLHASNQIMQSTTSSLRLFKSCRKNKQTRTAKEQHLFWMAPSPHRSLYPFTTMSVIWQSFCLWLFPSTAQILSLLQNIKIMAPAGINSKWLQSCILIFFLGTKTYFSYLFSKYYADMQCKTSTCSAATTLSGIYLLYVEVNNCYTYIPN